MPDKYSSFEALEAGEILGADYRIHLEDRGAPIAVIAPHGGYIEPGTSQIAEAIAADTLSFYSFEGLKKGRPHGDLHITSSKFDEPQGVALVGSAVAVVAIHGRANDGSPTIWMGGRDEKMRDAIMAALKSAGFSATFDPGHLPGLNPNNICNRSRNGAGVQLELPLSLRGQLEANPEQMTAFASAVRNVVKDW